MRAMLRVTVLTGVLVLTGCADRFQPSPISPNARVTIVRTALGPVPIDPDFRLTVEQRQELRPLFDPDALETFLAALPQARRSETFDLFRRRRPGEPVPLLTDVGGGPLQELLDEVWAPRWLASPEQLVNAPPGPGGQSYELPGRAAALRRLRARESNPRGSGPY
jgi:hypothetical protein